MSDRVTHPIPPIYNKESKTLILGSFPSVKSREGEFFYHHPQNRFWRVMSSLFHEPLPDTIEEKKQLLLRNKIALWDVIESCEIVGSSDSSIRNVIPNDISRILKTADIQRIIANGGTAYRLYMKYIFPECNREIIKLPSTSPANAAFSFERLMEEWSYIIQ
ncbi:MAG: DNA-deoxyinosine glycosylase [Lachnospiraceae bacterium]|nr:DNA-deoxyinosine glycosylase [Lachnospiraceae bacterium]